MSAVQHIKITNEDDEGIRLDRWFKRRFPHIPHGRVEKLLRTGQLRIDGKRAKGKMRLEMGQTVRVPPLPEPGVKQPPRRLNDQDMKFMQDMVIYEDNDMLALNKPAGLAVQGGTKTSRHIDGMLMALAYKGRPPRLVHRLDKDTSGVLVVAKNSKSAAWIAKAFQNRRARKVYWGITNGVPRPQSGEVKGYVAKGAGFDGREIMIPVRHGSEGAKHARTFYQCAQVAGKQVAWVVMQPLTGRKHQLRLHMQLLETPLIGDPKYGCDREEPVGLEARLHLHARSLVIPTPDGSEVHIQAKLSPHMQRAFDVLDFNPKLDIGLMEE
ncbi:MAG: RluA family pseudouridine synthase [Robiginitomaculum sp.]